MRKSDNSENGDSIHDRKCVPNKGEVGGCCRFTNSASFPRCVFCFTDNVGGL